MCLLFCSRRSTSPNKQRNKTRKASKKNNSHKRIYSRSKTEPVIVPALYSRSVEWEALRLAKIRRRLEMKSASGSAYSKCHHSFSFSPVLLPDFLFITIITLARTSFTTEKLFRNCWCCWIFFVSESHRRINEWNFLCVSSSNDSATLCTTLDNVRSYMSPLSSKSLLFNGETTWCEANDGDCSISERHTNSACVRDIFLNAPMHVHAVPCLFCVQLR